MKTSCPIHLFDVSYEDAKQIQSELRNLLETHDSVASIDDIDLVGGVDVAFIPSDPDLSAQLDGDNRIHDVAPPETLAATNGGEKTDTTAIAVAVTIDRRSVSVVEMVWACAPVFFPYVPGLLSFREGPAVLKAIGELSVLPGVMIYDGCGIAHPRGLGLASHMALLSGIPSVGCAKSLLCGSCEEPGISKGDWTTIMFHDRIVGCCVRTRDNVRPVYVSPGNGFSVEDARNLVLSLSVKYRLPEPTRLAHKFVTAQKKSIMSVNPHQP